MDFLRQAAADPHVLAIKQTLYRTGHESPLVDALVAAAQAGKDVTVIIELRARFDEEANIELSNRLQEAGAHVMYGVVGYKTHAKLPLVVRREAGGIRRYCHLGTGNYHPRTARAVHRLRPVHLRRRDRARRARDVPAADQPDADPDAASACCSRPSACTRWLLAHDRARDRARARRAPGAHHRQDERAGGAAVDRGAVPRLARRREDRSDRARRVRAAARACPGVSENIRVRSIVGRFLEHSRVFYFENDGEPELYLRERRLDGAQLLPPRGGGVPDSHAPQRERILRDLELCLSRQLPGVEAAARRQL